MRIISWIGLFLTVSFSGGACDRPVTGGDPVPPGEVLKVSDPIGAMISTISRTNIISNVNASIIVDNSGSTTGCTCLPYDSVCQSCDSACNITNLDGAACADDGNMCTNDVCAAGACTHPLVAAGTTCSDGNSCTTGDTCSSAGVCAGTAVTCTALDQCHIAGTCTAGTCSNPNKADATPCDDKSACTANDTCQAGVCTGGTTTTCAASDQCHDVGSCDPGSGTCSNPAKANNTACDDKNPCTLTDTCQAGVCTGGAAKVCTAIDQCHAAGTCDTGTGNCSNPNKNDGTTCDADGSKCTPNDTCMGGVCTKDPKPVACIAKDCNTVACDPTSGNCAYTPTTGTCGVTGCSQQGTCSNGVCSGTPKDCSGLNTECQVGLCDSLTGNCAASNVVNGTACAATEKCLASAMCENGTCSKTPLVCPPPASLCQTSACDPTSGACAVTSLAMGAACDTSNSCMSGATCNAQGQCAGTPSPNGTACTDSQGASGVCAAGHCATVSTPDGSASGPPDAATTDAAPKPDTSSTDTGSTPDAAQPVPDAAQTPDAGSALPDSGSSNPDSGTIITNPPAKSSGCCEISATPMPGAPLLFAACFALLLLRKSRRSRRR